MKKFKLALATATMIVLCASPTLAYGGSHHRRSGTKYSVCTVQNCSKVGVHTHSGSYYTSHYYGDGHDYHSYCSIEDCTLTGYHSHDGVYCFGHTANDGHSYHHTGGGYHH